jgi:hypothetical protein
MSAPVSKVGAMTDTAAGITTQERVVRGVILAESLAAGTVLDGHGMRIIRLSRYELSDAAEYQPSVWTAIDFELNEDSAPALADQLAASLLPLGWYVNWSSDAEATVVFPGKIFRYRRGDLAARLAAQEHGRLCGVPEPQLDWTD